MGAPETGLIEIHAGIERYYTAALRRHGATPAGVDWRCRPTQQLRFVQLLRITPPAGPLSLNDLGCGYGALLSFLAERRGLDNVDYLGIDLSAAMVRRARRLWPGRQRGIAFRVGAAPGRLADYSVASGVFNVQLDRPLGAWEGFVARTLADLHATSRLGFAVNFMAAAAAGAAGRPGLYRAVPERWARHCEREFGGRVDVVDGYGMREFTLLVHRAGHVDSTESLSSSRRSGLL